MADEAFSGIATWRDARADTDHTQTYRKVDEPSTKSSHSVFLRAILIPSIYYYIFQMVYFPSCFLDKLIY